MPGRMLIIIMLSSSSYAMPAPIYSIYLSKHSQLSIISFGQVVTLQFGKVERQQTKKTWR